MNNLKGRVGTPMRVQKRRKPNKGKKLTIHEKAVIIQLLEARRVYFESRNTALAKEASNIILKLGKVFY